ncbi:hypothetical protein P4N68_06360 [Corynebacterium felinum]|uniref:SWIM-type domain-containing protein n=1 Tax=Corynebacterium felinum TaxID=131318 RepID=A0ABU2BAA2_9CORY|nr:hypothetical protein [Corynebacterium felinum]MDF5820702.1 hypothetical protein [Corynebacterium felinum]MDR7355523.1 hypothetical protein [Corynebacterium felinum]
MTYQLPPQLIHEIVSGLPTRLKKRAEALTAESSSWTISPDPLIVVIGSNTVSFTDGSLACDCLLSPKCAHCGAVALAADIEETQTDQQPAHTAQDTGENPPETTTTLTQQEALKEAHDLIAPVIKELVFYGIPALNPLGYAQLVAAVHHARTHKLHRLERSLTAVARLWKQCRTTQATARPRRQALAHAFGALLEITHLITHQPFNPATVGVARRVYAELTPGRDDGIFTPIFAEPVITDSGFAGAVVTFADKTGTLFTVGKTPPGNSDTITRVWQGPVQLGDINTSLAQLSTRTVIISGGTVSADGRIGAGKKTRAAQGHEVLLEHVRAIPGVHSVTGEVTYADFAKVSLGSGGEYSFSATAQRCGVAGLVSKILGEKITLIISEEKIRAIWLGQQRLIPGLDLRGADVAKFSAFTQLANIHPTPHTIIASWIQRFALQGNRGICHTQIARDVEKLRSLNAPTAAQLLERLATCYNQHTVTALAFYASATKTQ